MRSWLSAARFSATATNAGWCGFWMCAAGTSTSVMAVLSVFGALLTLPDAVVATAGRLAARLSCPHRGGFAVTQFAAVKDKRDAAEDTATTEPAT